MLLPRGRKPFLEHEKAPPPHSLTRLTHSPPPTPLTGGMVEIVSGFLMDTSLTLALKVSAVQGRAGQGSAVQAVSLTLDELRGPRH